MMEKKTPLRAAILLLCGVVIGTALLTAVYALPVETMYRRVAGSLCIFETEAKMPMLVPARLSTRLDNQTDALMLNAAVTDSGMPPLEAAMYACNTVVGERTDNVDEFLQMYSDADEPRQMVAYTRYWHGYLVTLKPLLLVMEYGGIRLLNMYLQTSMLLTVILLASRRLRSGYVLALSASVAAMLPQVIAPSLQYSSVYYLMLLSLIAVLAGRDWLKQRDRFPLMLFVTGMLTGFFDYLTYPLATLGMPLIVFLLESDGFDRRRSLKVMLSGTVMWGLGYALMWAAKWLVAALATGTNPIKSVLEAASHRIGNEGGLMYRLSAIGQNIGIFGANKPFLIFAGLLLAGSVLGLVLKKLRFTRSACAVHRTSLLLIALLPPAWYFLLAEHSLYHCFPHRALAVSMFALISAGMTFVKTETGTKKATDLQESDAVRF